MRTTIKILIAVMVAAAFTSCELDVSDNGKLDGNWRMVAVDTLATEGTLSYEGCNYFWAVQHKLLMTIDRDRKKPDVLFRFRHDGDSLVLTSPYVSNRNDGDLQVNDVAFLRHYGINNFTESFFVEALSSSQMVLRSKMLRIKFRKM